MPGVDVKTISPNNEAISKPETSHVLLNIRRSITGIKRRAVNIAEDTIEIFLPQDVRTVASRSAATTAKVLVIIAAKSKSILVFISMKTYPI